MAGFARKFESATVEWPTPQELFDELNNEFCFMTDVAATDENARSGCGIGSWATASARWCRSE